MTDSMGPTPRGRRSKRRSSHSHSHLHSSLVEQVSFWTNPCISFLPFSFFSPFVATSYSFLSFIQNKFKPKPILLSNLIYKYNAIDSFIFVFSIPGVFGKEYLFHENKTFLFALYDMFSVISAPLEPCPSIKTRQLISSF